MKKFFTQPIGDLARQNSLTFLVTNFQVLGNTNDELKEIMAPFTTDHRTLINGFQRKK